MVTIGLIREGKIPIDNRVALTPSQCKWIHKNFKDIRIIVQHSGHRCFSDKEYLNAGIGVTEDISGCSILMGIKEVPVEMLIPGKTYFIFSHTKKLQQHNRQLLQAILTNKITLVDYECLEHDDGTRILGFGFFAGMVGAHDGIMGYGKRTASFELNRVNAQKTITQLIHTYFGLKLPVIKIAVTGSGRVAHGVLEIMNILGVHEVEPDQFLQTTFTYPVYVHLKGADLYSHRLTGNYNRIDFHNNPRNYTCLFPAYLSQTDILMNGVYWEKNIPGLFEMKDLQNNDFKIATISDISDDRNGSVPCNIWEATIDDPVYGVDKNTLTVTAPYLKNSVDVIAVGNLPNELPRDASRYFGEQIIKYVLEDIITQHSPLIRNATIVKNGELTLAFEYMREYSEV